MTDVKFATIGDRIKYARLCRNLSQRQVAEKVGVHQKTISNMEKNLGFSTPKLAKVAGVLGNDYNWIRHGVGTPPEPLDVSVPSYSHKQEIERLNESVTHLKEMFTDMNDTLKRLTNLVETLVESKQPRS